MKRISFLLVTLLLICFASSLTLVSCKSDVKTTDLEKLNGYWEIKEVTLADGETKDYKVNETIDFFEVKDKVGFRQKVMPLM